MLTLGCAVKLQHLVDGASASHTTRAPLKIFSVILAHPFLLDLKMGTVHVPPTANGSLSTIDSVEEADSVDQDLIQLPDPGSEDVESGERQPLISSHPPEEDGWVAPRHFTWIEIAIMSNVFLYGFDGTITAATYAVISSEFDATNTASWLTTSYLITSTAFQPLYGRVSDIFGRRICFFISTITFAIGCLGCGLANDIILLNCMRALAGFGGGGLMTMGKRYYLSRFLSSN